MKLTIRSKLLASFAFVLALLIAIGTIAIVKINDTGGKLESIDKKDMPSLIVLADLGKETLNVQRLLARFIIEDHAADKDRLEKELNDSAEAIKQLRKQLEPYLANTEQKELYAEFGGKWDVYMTKLPPLLAIARNGDLASAIPSLDETVEIARKVRANLDGIITLKREASAKSTAETMAANQSAQTVVLVLGVIAVAAATGLAIVISGMISKALAGVVRVVSKVAGGDLTETCDVRQKDEIGQLATSVNEMVGKLRELITQVMGASQSVAAAAEQISAGSQEIAAGASSQATAAQTIQELFVELSKSIDSVAGNAEDAARLSDDTRRQAQEGGRVVEASVEGMSQLNAQMSLLREDSDKIEAIIAVIDEIAEQTNLLALNAAIEAARAGEQGRGFAVVAEEVRKLAERSGTAAKQIGAIIKGMQGNTLNSAKAAQEAARLSEETGISLKQMILNINGSSRQVTEIAAASEEQAAQSGEVGKSIELIAATSEEAAAAAEETAASTQSLAKLADELHHSVSMFKV
ncbi:methyl-accepting chemotaxis protein [Paenibacillus sp. MBLB4367]|uniref:methyl-accepting chemotaxis protein n=1 Tax=Paenibacillus sp. MBLB4367 TaxID=3384767 RepID=UPI0039083114